MDGRSLPTRFDLRLLPLSIGRSPGQDIVLPVSHVSARHARILERDGRLWLCDLDSSNGTCINGERVTGETPLSSGDVLAFAGLEFVLERATPREQASRHTSTGVMPCEEEGSIQGLRSKGRLLEKLIAQRAVSPVFQPIVNFENEAELAFELLGRGALRELPTAPGPLFQIAEAVGLAVTLSELFRGVGLDGASELPGGARVFINAHPLELNGNALLPSLTMVRTHFPEMPLALEVHEGTVTDPRHMREMRAALRDIEIPVAFDDFGAGQTRLLELTESPPDYLKFDMSLIRDIHLAAGPRQAMLEQLVSIAKSMGVYCVAEGIECHEELETCRQIGFEFGQGFAIGRPLPAGAWLPGSPHSGQHVLEETTVGIFRRRQPVAGAAARTGTTRSPR